MVLTEDKVLSPSSGGTTVSLGPKKYMIDHDQHFNQNVVEENDIFVAKLQLCEKASFFFVSYQLRAWQMV